VVVVMVVVVVVVVVVICVLRVCEGGALAGVCAMSGTD
jgi:hypothetical protein